MVQIVEENRKKSLGENLIDALRGGVEAFSQFQQGRRQRQAQELQGESLSNLVGQNLSGLDPETQKMAANLLLQGRNQQALELMKQMDPLHESTINLNKIKAAKEAQRLEFYKSLGKEPYEMEDTEVSLPGREEYGQEKFGMKGLTDYLLGFEEELPSERQEQIKPDYEKKTAPSKIPKLIPQQRINQALQAGENALANSWQKYNEDIKTQQRHEESLQSKEVIESYKINKDFIDKTLDKYDDSKRKEAIIERMNQLVESGNLTDSSVINLLEQLGIKPEWLKNPENEEYTKLALDLLGGGTLQQDYGSRILASEFNVSMQRIPTLLQTSEGKRQIAENIKTTLLPSILKYERLQYYLDKQEKTGKPLPLNLKSKILHDIKPKLEEAYDKFKYRNGRYKVKKGTVPDNNSIEKYYYISNGNEKMARKMMKEDGYDIE